MGTSYKNGEEFSDEFLCGSYCVHHVQSIKKEIDDTFYLRGWIS